jgi:hypothetical protein
VNRRQPLAAWDVREVTYMNEFSNGTSRWTRGIFAVSGIGQATFEGGSVVLTDVRFTVVLTVEVATTRRYSP